jgi:hypothetical protein
MNPTDARPLGGRFTQWLDGKPIVAADVLPKRTPDGRVTTAPLPVRVPAATAIPSLVATVPGPPASVPGSARGPERAGEVVAPARKPAEIKDHPGADKLLAALSSYNRPYLVEETRETDGHPAARYAGQPRSLSPGVPTPPREPRTKLTDSLVKELGERKAGASRDASARAAATVLRPAVAASDGRKRALSPSGRDALKWPREILIFLATASIVCAAVCGAVLVRRAVATRLPLVSSEVVAPGVETLSTAAPAEITTAAGRPATELSGAPAAVTNSAAPKPPTGHNDVILVPAVAPSNSAAKARTRTTAPTTDPATVPSSAIPIKPTFQVQN